MDFIQEMRDYAANRNPDFIIIQQNAASLIEGHAELTGLIDAISQEAIWYDGDATDDWYDPDGYDWENDSGLVSYYIGYLVQYLAAGLPVRTTRSLDPFPQTRISLVSRLTCSRFRLTSSLTLSPEA